MTRTTKQLQDEDYASKVYYAQFLEYREKYTRDPFDCEKCRREHGVSPFHYGPDPRADCGKCIADSVIKEVFGK